MLPFRAQLGIFVVVCSNLAPGPASGNVVLRASA